MLKFKKTPEGSYEQLEPILPPELFDLIIATFNILGMHDISGSSLLDYALEERHTHQEILDAAISNLQELSDQGLMDAPHVFMEGEAPNLITVQEIEGWINDNQA